MAPPIAACVVPAGAAVLSEQCGVTLNRRRAPGATAAELGCRSIGGDVATALKVSSAASAGPESASDRTLQIPGSVPAVKEPAGSAVPPVAVYDTPTAVLLPSVVRPAVASRAPPAAFSGTLAGPRMTLASTTAP